MSTPRLRTINTAARELKKIDPDTAVSAAAIRRLVKQGRVPCIHSGNRAYLNFDALLAYLEKPFQEETHPPVSVHGVRSVRE